MRRVEHFRAYPVDFSGALVRRRFFGGSSQPSGQTTTTTSNAPWSSQQPYLQQGFADSSGMYNSNPNGYTAYPGQQVAGLNNQQTDIMGQQVQSGLAGGSAALQQTLAGAGNIAAGNTLGQNTGNQYLTGTAGGSGLNANPANGMESGIAGGSQLNSNPGSQMLQNTASGAMLSAQNPAFQQMAQTTLANTMPGIDAGFGSGGRLDSGLATRAASEGANDAVGGLAYQNYQQGLQNQLQAQTTIGNNYNTAQGVQQQAIGQIGSNYNTAAGLQQNAADQLSTNYTNDQGNQLKAGLVAQAGDQQQQSDYNNAFGAASQYQNNNQQNINALMNNYSFNQQQPYAALQRYMQGVQGSYGSSGAQSTPYYSNGVANTLAGATGVLGLANGINNLGGAATTANAGSTGLLSSLFS